jgi:hypothetical protein
MGSITAAVSKIRRTGPRCSDNPQQNRTCKLAPHMRGPRLEPAFIM